MPDESAAAQLPSESPIPRRKMPQRQSQTARPAQPQTQTEYGHGLPLTWKRVLSLSIKIFRRRCVSSCLITFRRPARHTHYAHLLYGRGLNIFSWPDRKTVSPESGVQVCSVTPVKQIFYNFISGDLHYGKSMDRHRNARCCHRFYFGNHSLRALGNRNSAKTGE